MSDSKNIQMHEDCEDIQSFVCAEDHDGYGPTVQYGTKFGRWTALFQAEDDKYGYRKWRCICECGNQKDVSSKSLVYGHSKSCGCLLHDMTFKHGQSGWGSKKKTKEYSSYNSMKERCLNPNHAAYHDWGGRGITVCQRWLESFENFFKRHGKLSRRMLSR